METTDYKRRRRKNVERNFSRRDLQRRILRSHSVKILSLTNYRFKVSFHFKDNSNNFCVSANCCCLRTYPYISHFIAHVTYKLTILQSVFLDRAQPNKDPQWIMASIPQINLLLINFTKIMVQISYNHSKALKLCYTLDWVSFSPYTSSLSFYVIYCNRNILFFCRMPPKMNVQACMAAALFWISREEKSDRHFREKPGPTNKLIRQSHNMRQRLSGHPKHYEVLLCSTSDRFTCPSQYVWMHYLANECKMFIYRM